MKNYISILLIFLCITAKAKDETPVASKIKSVTVFLNRAEVTNVSKVGVIAGTSTLVFTGLSTRLISNSIQVAAKGITLMSVKHRVNYLKDQKVSPKMKSLQTQLETEQMNFQRLVSKEKIYEQEEDMILKNKSIGGQQNGVSAQRLTEIANFYRQRLLEISNARLTLKLQISKQKIKVNNLKKQIREESNNTKPTSEIVLVVKANSATTASFEVSYIVQNAGWTPIYDIRAKDSNNPIKLAYKANVYQNTGVDWKNVNIKLSTGNPAIAGNKPEFNPLYVDKLVSYQNDKGSGYRHSANKKEAKEIKATEVVEVEEVEDESLADLTEVSVNTFSTEFEITVPYSIPSDGKPQLVDVQIFDVSTNYRHEAIPKLDNDAFLMADLLDWEKYNLLPGKANVYFEGTFVGETSLNPQNTNDTLSVSLGRDKKIIIERNKIKDYTSKKFLGSNVKETIGQEIAIRNTTTSPINITIEEPIPVSMNNSIEVKLLESSGAKYDESTGKLTWKMTIASKETKKIIVKYSLRYPKKLNIEYR